MMVPGHSLEETEAILRTYIARFEHISDIEYVGIFERIKVEPIRVHVFRWLHSNSLFGQYRYLYVWPTPARKEHEVMARAGNWFRAHWRPVSPLELLAEAVQSEYP